VESWLNSLAGLCVGMLVGATGVGGGAVMTPILVLLVGVAPHTAVGTDLVYASLTKMFGVAVHGAYGRIDWLVVRRLALGSLPVASLTLIWLHATSLDSSRQAVIVLALGMVLMFTSVAMIAKPYLNQVGRKYRVSFPVEFKRYQPLFTVMAGAVLGFLVALTSIGAGALGTVMLVYLYPFRLTPAKLVGTDLAHAIPLALLCGAGHILMGNVDFRLLGQLLLGSIPGVWLGAYLAGKLPDNVLRIGIAVVLGMTGARLLS